jgi:hypothetical protein
MSREQELARELVDLKAKEVELKKAKSDAAADVKAKQQELIDHLLSEGKNSTGHIDGVGNFQIARSVFPYIRAEHQPRFIDSLRGTEDFGIVKETIPAPTLKRFLKDKIEQTINDLLDDPQAMDRYTGSTPSEVAHEIWGKKDVTVHEEYVLRHTGKGK